MDEQVPEKSVDLNARFRAGAVQEYDPEPGRDRVRARMAGALLGFVGVLAVAGFYLFTKGIPIDAIERLFVIIFNPIVGMAGIALGFYFGTSQRK